eukprot:Skav223332  [mRNA]  locus=scaffold200:148307:149140:+ [translate_table: standard]
MPCRQKRWGNVVQSRWLRNGASGVTKFLSVVHMSDTHGKFYDVPDGDILIHSGDFTYKGKEVNDFMSYFKALPHKYKVLVPGNHELDEDRLPVDDLRRMLGCTPGSNMFLLVDESVTIEGIKIYGSPWTQESQRRERWQYIPKDTDILVTHMPPYKIFDFAWQPDGFFHWGCRALLQRIAEVAPAMHCFGHVHDDVGVKPISFNEVEVLFSNAAMDLPSKRAVNMFTFEASVDMSSVESKEAEISTVGSVGDVQVEGIAPIDLQEAVKLCEVYFRAC